jgi:hypothetical protein|tara:strand:- start:21 stop:467 length:447 start_codon:yes stop_codon:yes gene_type:complete
VIIVTCKFNKKVKELLKSVDVDIKELERYTNFILNEYKGTRNIWDYDLTIKMIECNTSGYYFEENLMELGNKTLKRSIPNKRKWYLSSYFHELCHFAQDNLDKVSQAKLDYTDKDASECNDTYYENPYEVQARQWEDKYTDAYISIFY